jgi:hypothetical protein
METFSDDCLRSEEDKEGLKELLNAVHGDLLKH